MVEDNLKYFIKSVDDGSKPVRLNSSVWECAEVGKIECECWSGFSKAPKTDFCLLRGEKGFYVRMRTDEKNLRFEVKEQNGNIYQDSCMEFFVSADSKSRNYLNFEFNPNGILHLGFGENRLNRFLIDVPRDIFRIESSATDGDWNLMFYIPDEFLLNYFSVISESMMANFYKCGDLTDHQHYASWASIDTESPDFHRPEFFGFLGFSK